MFQLTHKNYYRAHNFAARVSLSTQASVYNNIHGNVVRILVTAVTIFLRAAILPTKVKASA